MFAPIFLLEYFKIKFCAELNNDEFIDIITIRIPITPPCINRILIVEQTRPMPKIREILQGNTS